MQNVKKMVEQKVGGGHQTGQPSTDPHFHHGALPRSGHNNDIHRKPVDYVLPSRRRADVLMSAYWRHVHVLLPISGQNAILEDYEKLWKETAPFLMNVPSCA